MQEGQALLRRVPEVDIVMGPQHANQITTLLDQASDGQVSAAAHVCTARAVVSPRSSMPRQGQAITASLRAGEISSAGACMQALERCTLTAHRTQLRARACCATLRGLRGEQVVATEWRELVEDVTVPRRESALTAWVNVIHGCNEKCSYCVVPYTRGAEQSRTPAAIRAEVAALAAAGYREVTLLGQARRLPPRTASCHHGHAGCGVDEHVVLITQYAAGKSGPDLP